MIKAFESRINRRIPILFLLFFLLMPTAFGRSKQYHATTIIKILESSITQKRKVWDYAFTTDYCDFHKTQSFYDREKRLRKKKDITIPLVKVKMEIEKEKYDNFFTCEGRKDCILDQWLNSEGKVMESRKRDIASLYIANRKIAEDIFDNFKKLQSLCNQKEYPGPINTTWGQADSSVRDHMPKRFPFVRSEVRNLEMIQYYTGDFSGYKTEQLKARYVEGRFYRFDVHILPEEAQPVAKLWKQVFRTVEEKYGPPLKLILPASLSNLDQFEIDGVYKTLEKEIRGNYWIPKAIWQFENDAFIEVTVTGSYDKKYVLWFFYHKKMRDELERAQQNIIIDDF